MSNIYLQGAVVSVIGLCTVFLVLAILWGTLELMRVVFTRSSKKEQPSAPAPVPAAPVAPVQPVQSDDEELIAVLTAAVAACLGQPASSLRIKSYRRAESHAPVWNQTARRDNLIG